MANARIRLPVVGESELTDPVPVAANDAHAAALEAALTADLGALAAAAGRPMATPGDPPPPAANTATGTAADKPDWESIDPDVVAQRLAQHLRRSPVGEISPREATPASPRTADHPDPVAAAMARWGTERHDPPAASSVAAFPRPDAARSRPAPQRPPGGGRSFPRSAAPAGPSPDEALLTDRVEQALRGWSGDGAPADLYAGHRRPRRGISLVGALLLVGAGAGAMVALQWGGPRDQALAPLSQPVSSIAAVDRVAPAGSVQPAAIPTPTAAAADVAVAVPVTPPDPPKAVNVVDVAPSGAIFEPAPGVIPPPSVGAPAPAIAATAATPTAAEAPARPRPAGPKGQPLPSWFVEDDPAMLDPAHRAAAAALGGTPVTEPATAPAAAPPAAIAARRMVVTADVDVRTAPDAKAASLGVLRAGSVIAVGECTVWCEVTINARSGWVFYSFLADPSAFTAATR